MKPKDYILETLKIFPQHLRCFGMENIYIGSCLYMVIVYLLVLLSVKSDRVGDHGVGGS